LLSILVGGPACISRKESKVTGRASNHEGKPLAEVKVQVFDAAISIYTKADRTFTLENSKRKKVSLLLSHPDYVPQSIEIDTSGKTGHVFVVSLAPKSPILMTVKEEITVSEFGKE